MAVATGILEELGEDLPRALRISTLRDLVETQAEADYSQQALGKRIHPGTGFERFDYLTGGGLQPGLHIMSGDPGQGKTALALQIATDCGFPALYVTAEMAPLVLVRRLIANKTGTDIANLHGGKIRPSEYMNRFDEMAAKCSQLAILDATDARVTSDIILREAEALADGGRVLVVMDYLQAWALAVDGGRTEYEALAGGISSLVGISTRLDSPILVVVARNRAAQREGGGLSGAAGSHKIEYSGHTFFDLTKGDQTPDGIEMTITLQKNRTGPVGSTMGLLFDGSLQLFTEKS